MLGPDNILNILNLTVIYIGLRCIGNTVVKLRLQFLLYWKHQGIKMLI
jgi:hypothetical protein